jgi:hypothetical protein
VNGAESRDRPRAPILPCDRSPTGSGSWVPLSFHSSSHCPQTRVPVCLPIGADRQGRLVPRSRVKRLDSHEVRSMRGTRAQLVGMRVEITHRSGAFSRPLALSYHGALANRANDSSKDEGDDSYTLIRSRRDLSVLQRVFRRRGIFSADAPEQKEKKVDLQCPNLEDKPRVPKGSERPCQARADSRTTPSLRAGDPPPLWVAWSCRRARIAALSVGPSPTMASCAGAAEPEKGRGPHLCHHIVEKIPQLW